MPSLTFIQSSQRSPKRRSASPAKPNATRSSQAGGFGLLLLLLAAMPYDEQGRDGALDAAGFSSTTRPTLASTANLRFCASMEDVMRAGRRALEFDCDYDNDVDEEDDDANIEETDEERRRRRKRKQLQKQQDGLASAPDSQTYATTSGSDEEISSQGNTDDEIGSNSFASVPTTSTTTADHEITLSTLSEMGEDCLSLVMGFLPLKDVSICRGVSKAFQSAAACDVPTPFAGSVFMRFGNTHRGRSFATAPNRSLLKWNCSYCATQNSVNFNQCRQCQGGNGDSTGVRKVFLGQLRKERTTEIADWILSRLYPEMTPMHIENHTGKDNRGKGCAWIYVTSAADEAKVLALNKRMFIDIDDNGQEGVWLTDKEHVEELNNMATSRAYTNKRPLVLPRQPMVAEKPGSKPQVSRGNSNTASLSNQGPKSEWQQKKQQQQDTQATAQELYEQYSTEHKTATAKTSAPAKAAPAASKKTPASASSTAAGFPTHNNGTMNPAPRSRQHAAATNSVPAPKTMATPQPRRTNNHLMANAHYQYQPNSINVFDYQYPSTATSPQQYQARPKSPSSGSSTGSQASTWSHNPYGYNVIADQHQHSSYNYQNYVPAYHQGPASDM